MIDVRAEDVWQSFFDTGDPVSYLLAKKLDREERRRDNRENREGKDPRPAD